MTNTDTDMDMDTDTTVQTLAGELYAALVTGTRPDGDRFINLTDGSPEWMVDLCRAAHDTPYGLMLPDDYRYDVIREAAEYITDDDDEDGHDFADGGVDVYTVDLLAWVGSHGFRRHYVKDACNEYGVDPDRGEDGRWSVGQYAERVEVYGAVLAALNEQVENEDEDEGVQE